MPGTCRKYTREQEGAFKVSILHVLDNSEVALSIDEIKLQDTLNLGIATNQKLSRVMGELIKMGLVKKSKSKSTGRMMYKAVSKMVEQGYEPEVEINFIPTPYSTSNWELEEEKKLMEDKIYV